MCARKNPHRCLMGAGVSLVLTPCCIESYMPMIRTMRQPYDFMMLIYSFPYLVLSTSDVVILGLGPAYDMQASFQP